VNNLATALSYCFELPYIAVFNPV